MRRAGPGMDQQASTVTVDCRIDVKILGDTLRISLGTDSWF